MASRFNAPQLTRWALAFSVFVGTILVHGPRLTVVKRGKLV